MSCASWNGRGLGGAATVKELRDFARKYAPTVLCVLETQVDRTRAESLSRTLGYDHAFAVRSFGRKGGICIFWNNDIKVEILPYSITLILSSQSIARSHGDLLACTGKHEPTFGLKRGRCSSRHHTLILGLHCRF
jgi:exonuclease III